MTTTTPARGAARRTAVIVRWAVQIVLASQFASAGIMKLAGTTQMVDLFTDIGAGQWLRYLVGACEVAGAVGLLTPRLVAVAATALAALMVGAAVTNVVLGVSPVLPLVYLIVAAGLAWSRRAQLRRLALAR